MFKIKVSEPGCVPHELHVERLTQAIAMLADEACQAVAQGKGFVYVPDHGVSGPELRYDRGRVVQVVKPASTTPRRRVDSYGVLR